MPDPIDAATRLADAEMATERGDYHRRICERGIDGAYSRLAHLSRTTSAVADALPERACHFDFCRSLEQDRECNCGAPELFAALAEHLREPDAKEVG